MSQPSAATKTAGARLLRNGDENLLNPFKKAVVGWKPILGVPRSFANTNNGFAAVWSIVQKTVEGTLADLYEQPQIVENPGSVVIPRMGDKYGLISVFRNTRERIESADPNYILDLFDNNRWEELLDAVGETKWELPAGIAPAEEGDNLNELVIKAAKMEALQEAGYTVGNAQIVGRPNFNPTWFLHAQYVVLADIEAMGEAQHEDLEIIGVARLFTVQEIRGLIDRGELNDGKTLTAFAMAGIHIPLAAA